MKDKAQVIDLLEDLNRERHSMPAQWEEYGWPARILRLLALLGVDTDEHTP
jgi:hypothetical protein